MFQLYVSVDLNLNFSACCLVSFQYKNHLLWFRKTLIWLKLPGLVVTNMAGKWTGVWETSCSGLETGAECLGSEQRSLFTHLIPQPSSSVDFVALQQCHATSIRAPDGQESCSCCRSLTLDDI